MINFAGGFNLPIWMTQRQGLFAAEKIDIKIDFTPGSTYQLTHLIAGTYDMGFTAIDNIIAYREGQNEAYLPPGTDVDLIAVLASDDGFLSIDDTPGLGVDLDEQKAASYPYQTACLPVNRKLDGTLFYW